ncbi:MAG: hypothetical protein E7306_11050 [Butyrivibrio sp.]|nr:hypothetical protein [Butyrivibrio sp.]
MKRIITGIILAMTMLVSACGQDKVNEVSIDYGTSQIYTKADMDEAIVLIKEKFEDFEGCELHNIRYATDECNSEENIAWMNDLEEGQNFTQCIVFLSDFHTPKDGGLTWEPDTEYKDWTWNLARAEGGEWHLVTWGYD